MEYRIKDYTIEGQSILLPRQTSIEDLRLIFNETQKKLICSTATKDNVSLVQGEGGTLVEVPTSVCSLNSTDLLTIKCDYGDNLEEVKEAVENIDLTPIENKVDEGVSTLADKIDNINVQIPDIDITNLAKEQTLTDGVNALSDKIDNIQQPDIDTTQLAIEVGEKVAEQLDETFLASVAKESTLQEVSSKIDNLNTGGNSGAAKESTLLAESRAIKDKIDNINIELPEVDTSALAKERTLQEVSSKLDNLNVNVDLSNVAKQGENTEATNSKIYEEIQKIASVDSDILQGKRRIASALTLKGVDASYTESLQDFSIKINQISQKQYLSIGDDKFYYPQPYMQSIFVVAEDLKKSDMPEYIPAYVKEYKHMFGINQFVVVDYYQKDVVLESAEGALTSDGYFYTKTTNGYTQTLPNGETKAYEGDSVEHHFNNNGVINYWCAYFFTLDNYSFITKGNYLMNILVCGKCGSLDIAKFSNIYIDGEVVSLQCSESAQANSLTLVNFSNHSNGRGVIKANQYCKDIKILDLQSISNGSTIVDFDILETNGMQGLKYLSCPNLKEINTGGSIFSLNNFTAYTTKYIFLWYLGKIQFEELEKVDNTSFILKTENLVTNARQHALYNLEEINLPKLKECNVLFKAWYNTQNNIFWWFHNLKKLRLPSLKKVGATIFTQPIQGCYVDTSTNTVTSSPYNYIELVDYSSATEIGNNLGGICASHTKLDNLVDFRVGALEKSINTQYWTAANVIADETKKAQLQQNIHNYIAERVSNRTGMSALTFTFSQAVRNILLPETETLFAAKNWNIAPTRTS